MNKMTDPEQRKLDPWLEQIRSQVNRTAGEASSDDATWQRLESELFSTPIAHKPGRWHIGWWQATAAVMAALLVIGGLWLYAPRKAAMNETVPRPMAVIQDTPTQTSTSSPNQMTEDAVLRMKPSAHSTSNQPTIAPLLAIHQTEKNAIEEQTEQENASGQTHQDEDKAQTVPDNRKHPDTPNHPITPQPSHSTSNGMTATATSTASSDRNWQLSVFASNAKTTSKTTEMLVPIHDTAPMIFAMFDGALRSVVDDEERYQEASFHHLTPLQTGVRFFYKLSDRWRIGSGLTYTYLRSNSSATFETPTRTQQIHYLGVPLTMQYNLLSRSTWHLYVGTEVRMDKCLAVRWGDFVPEARPWQFSLSGTAGIGINLHQHLELYIEPNVGYYFDDRSPVKSLYKEQPLSFGISAGFIFK